jgi:hypothetical protein
MVYTVPNLATVMVYTVPDDNPIWNKAVMKVYLDGTKERG